MDDLINDISDSIFLENLKNEFMSSIAESIKILTEFNKMKKFRDMRKIAHDIKGIVGIFGFDKGSELAGDLQKAIDTLDRSQIEQNNTKLIDYLNKHVLEIKAEEK